MGCVKPGDIVLLHDFYPSSVDAALTIVDQLQAQGYTFVTVEELFRIQGVNPEAGVLYASPSLIRPLTSRGQPFFSFIKEKNQKKNFSQNVVLLLGE